MKTKTWALGALSAASAAALVACGGGGGDSTGPATMRLFLTDAPACGYDNVWVTVDRVRVHRSSTAEANDAGWVEMDVVPDRRVDLLTLTNGTLEPLGQMQLEAGTYTQMRLVLAPNTAANPLANAIRPTGGAETELTTPSGQQSGLKMNVNLTVNPDTVADFAIDFDACKSFVRAGNSGRYLLKPVLSVIPIISTNIIGWVDAAIANGNTGVSAQVDGTVLRSTVPDAATGRFVLPWIPTGTYNVVVTAPGRVNAVMTGVPVTSAGPTTIGSETVRLVPPASPASAAASGVISVAGSTANTNGEVRALQTAAGTRVEVAYAGADAASGVYRMQLPTGAPVSVPYAAGAASFPFAADASQAGRYRLEALAGTATTPLVQDNVVIPATVNFAFP